MNKIKSHHKKVVLTGGGTAGHVMPNLALMPWLDKAGWEYEYIGSTMGIERQLVGDMMPFHGISSGKLRRYFSWQNFTDFFRVGLGILQAFWLLRGIKPRVVFSKGGFVGVPVVIGAWLQKIPVVLHEGDLTPGLANRISLRFAEKICITFPETGQYLPENKWIYTGLPIRSEILKGLRESGYEFTGMNQDKPVLLVMGGSQGAQAINQVVREALQSLLEDFQVVHICGKGKVDSKFGHISQYRQFEYVKDELPHIFAIADVIVSRAGANALFEILALKLPNLLIPLSRKQSRGDQIQNARSFRNRGFSMILEEEQLTAESLPLKLMELYEKRQKYIESMQRQDNKKSAEVIVDLIEKIEGPISNT